VWRCGDRVEKVGCAADLREGHSMGETETHLAVGEASAWLEGQSARRRAVVLFIGGQPDDPPATSEAVIRHAAGGGVLVAQTEGRPPVARRGRHAVGGTGGWRVPTVSRFSRLDPSSLGPFALLLSDE
jgi:hypothetical protein